MSDRERVGEQRSRSTLVPTVEQMQTMGLVQCQSQPCPVWVDPVNLPGRRCLNHQREERRRRQAERLTRPELPSEGNRERDRRRREAKREA